MGSIVTLTSERLCLSCILPTYRVDTYYAVASRLDPTRNLVLFQNKTQSITYNNLQRHSTTANSFASPSHSHSFCLLRHLPRGLAQPLMKLLFFFCLFPTSLLDQFSQARIGERTSYPHCPGSAVYSRRSLCTRKIQVTGCTPARLSLYGL